MFGLLSFWEKQSFQSYDYLVVGAGLVGLSTAISIKEKRRSASVAIVERGILPSGASTKNAGFACFGSPTELSADIKNVGTDLALSIVEKRWKGLELLRERLGDNHIDFQQNGGYELISEKETYVLDQLDEINKWLRPLFKQEVFVEKPEIVAAFGFSQKHFSTAIFNPLEGQLHTGEMMKSLIGYANLLGINIYTGTTVEKWEEESDGIKIKAQSDKQTFVFKTSQLAICTNAFSKDLLPAIELNPGRGLVVVTEPIDDLAFKGTFHFDEGFYYFRNISGRVLFGGGRNRDFEKEETTQFGINEDIKEHLIELLQTVILQRTVNIEMEWSGIMAFGESKEPIIQKLSNNVVVGARMGGMGVAMGTKVGEELSELMLSED